MLVLVQKIQVEPLFSIVTQLTFAGLVLGYRCCRYALTGEAGWGENEKADSWSANRLRKHRSGRVGDQSVCEQQPRRRVVPRERIHELRHQKRWILRRSRRKTHQSWAAVTETSKPAICNQQ